MNIIIKNSRGSQRDRIIMRLAAIEKRLNKTTKPAPWKAVKGGTRVFVPELSSPDKPYYSSATDDGIIDSNEEEVLGTSEWLRVEWADLSFMAEARSDIEFLLAELKRVQGIIERMAKGAIKRI